jgi:RNA polymerase sigma factor for flagellar operon FliA
MAGGRSDMKLSTNLKPEAQDVMQNEERERIILEHMHQVEIIARRINSKIPASVELGDLISAGTLGLIDAVERYDESYDVKFNTFAEYRIRGAILDSLRDLDWAPRSLRRKSRKMTAVCGSLEQGLGRSPTAEEKCDALGIDLATYHTLTENIARMKINSLEDLRDTDRGKDPTPSLRIPDSSSKLPSALCEKNETSDRIDEAIAQLPPRERLTVYLYYYDHATMAEISKVLGVNESRISQIHSCAMKRLGTRLRSLNAAA